MFRRVASSVASGESEEKQKFYENAFFDLFMQKKFCSGGRVLAGANSSHGNVLNCFVQDGGDNVSGSNAWVMELSRRLALVTKVGGGNGLCLDPIPPRQEFDSSSVGKLNIVIPKTHSDYDNVVKGRYKDLMLGNYVQKGYRYATINRPEFDNPDTVMINVGDSIQSIWDSASTMVKLLMRGEDVQVYLGNLRAEGSPVIGSGGESSGAASFAVEVFDNFSYWASLGGANYAGAVNTLRYVFAPTLRVIRQGGTRRGAGMATMSIRNPDILEFIGCKDLDVEAKKGDISTFNISVLVGNADFYAEDQQDTIAKLVQQSWATGEPAMIFIDNINQNNAMYKSMGAIKATNPCGEIPLYSGEPCDLGAINLSTYAKDGIFQYDELVQDIPVMVRFLDNILDLNDFALEQNREMSLKLRRIGLGVMGLADCLIKLGYRYGSNEAIKFIDDVMSFISITAKEASEELAVERGAFPEFDNSEVDIPRRNVAFMTVAPTGTTAMLMGCSSGIEPIFAPVVHRRIGSDYMRMISPLLQELLEAYSPYDYPQFSVVDKADGDSWDYEAICTAIENNHGSLQGLELPKDITDVFVCAHDIRPLEHVVTQATVQQAFDKNTDKGGNSISKTINLPNSATVEDVHLAYRQAFDMGCKGITVYRDGSRGFQVLNTSKQEDESEEVQEFSSNPTAITSRFKRDSTLFGITNKATLTDAQGNTESFYTTVNIEPDEGKPVEVIVVSGKGGNTSNSDSEAMGRLVSIALQYGIPAEVLIETLEGINGGTYGTHNKRIVMSKADLIAVSLADSLAHRISGIQNTATPIKVKPMDGICPDCESELVKQEGCVTCLGCGYSKCG